MNLIRLRQLRGWVARLCGLFQRARREREFAEELESHLALHIEDNLRAGMSPDEARRVALIKLGGVTLTKQLHREQRGVPMLETLWQDLRFGLRILRKNPGFSFIAVLTLALGMGANTAIFSVVNAVLLRPLPYHEPERLAQIWESKGDGKNSVFSPGNFLDWQKQAKSFEGLSVYDAWLPALSTAGETEQIVGVSASSNYFSLLGVTPQLGRTFTPEEESDGQNRVVVISHSFWQNRLGSKADVIGKELTLDQSSYTIIGVLRPGFRHLHLIFDQQPVIFRPFHVERVASQRAERYLSAFGRLKTGVDLGQAQAEMTAIARQLEETYPGTNRDSSVNLVALHREVTGSISLILLILQGTVAFVLLIACVNVANLLLSRVAAREREMAVRTALGAGRWKIIRLLLTESALLALIGGVLGLVLARWGVDLLVSFAPPDLPRREDISLDYRALGFTFLLSLLTALLFGLLPGFQATRANLNDALKEGSRSGFRRQRLRSVLVVAELALALVLLVGSGLLIHSLVRLQSVNPGFDTENMLTMRIGLPTLEARFEQQIVIYQQILARLENLPGAKAAALTSSLPFAGSYSWSTDFKIEGQPVEPGKAPLAGWRLVSPAYFQTMGIPLRAGRTFTNGDTFNSIGVMVINESFARQHFPNVNPIGRTITPKWKPERPRQIVGVVSDFKHKGLASDVTPEMYVPYTQQTWSTMALVVRTNAEPEKIQVAVQKAIWEVNPRAPISRITTMKRILDEQVLHSRFNTLLLGIFSALALLLAAIGIYGVMSYAVSLRSHELGVRKALGAQNMDVIWLVVKQGMKLALLGIVLGIAGAYGLTRLMATLLYGVSTTDPLTFAGVVLLALIVTFLACWIPARRAAKVDPMITLRSE